MKPEDVLTVLGTCLDEAGDDLEAGLLAAEYMLARGMTLSTQISDKVEEETDSALLYGAASPVPSAGTTDPNWESSPRAKNKDKPTPKDKSRSRKKKSRKLFQRLRIKTRWRGTAFATDAEGNEHRGKGKGGGQFVSKGKGGDSGRGATGPDRGRDTGRGKQPGRPTDSGRVDRPGAGRPDAKVRPRAPAPRIVAGREGHTRRGDPGVVPESLRKHLNEHQQQATALAVPALDRTGGFLLADGTGLGKTRTILSTAKIYADRGKKVLLVSPASIIKPEWKTNSIAGTIGKDGALMGVDMQLTRGQEPLTPGKVHVTTYESLSKIKDHIDSDTVVLYDEAHGLKNVESTRSKYGAEISGKARGVLYATATPADHPLDVAYLFRTQLFGNKSFKEIKRSLNPDRSNPEEAYKATAELFDKLTDKGLMVKREISLDGVECSFDHVDLPSDARRRLSEIAERAIDSRQRAQVLMKQRFEQEKHKVPHATSIAQKELREGRQVILFVAGVSGTPEQPGTAAQLKSALVASGVPEHHIGQLHGGEGGGGKEEVAAFQRGQRKVLITTAQSGGTGHNLDDTTGDAPRTQILLTAPFSAIDNAQIWGRTHRLTTQSKSRIKYLFADTDVDRWNANLIKGKVKSLGAIVGGEAARQEPSVPFASTDADGWRRYDHSDPEVQSGARKPGQFAGKAPDTRTVGEKARDAVKGTPAYLGRRLTSSVQREVNRGLRRIEYELTAPIRYPFRKAAEVTRRAMEPVVQAVKRFVDGIMRLLGWDREETEPDDPTRGTTDNLLSLDDDVLLCLDQLEGDPDFAAMQQLLREEDILFAHDVSDEKRDSIGRWTKIGDALRSAATRARGIVRRGLESVRTSVNRLVPARFRDARARDRTNYRLDKAMSQQNVDPETRAKHRAAFEHISGNMSSEAHHLFTIGTRGGMKFHTDSDAVTREADDRDGGNRLEGNSRTHGFLDPNDNSLHLDGRTIQLPRSSTMKSGDALRHTSAHEMTHAIDFGHRARTGKKFSEDSDWEKAHRSEAAKLSDYAPRHHTDSFAEFGRLVYASDVPRATIKRDFPLGYAFFNKHGLINW